MGCTFCAIPQFRGRHRSRALGDIVPRWRASRRAGVQEAILVSQDTLAYGRDLPGNGDIGDLLLALAETRMPWIRPMYLHPAHVNDRLVERSGRRARIVPYLDMPVQHGDDGDPARDAPGGDGAAHAATSSPQFRAAIPDVTVRTTVLVGFPGETEAAFERAAGVRRGRGALRAPRRVHVLAGGGDALARVRRSGDAPRSPPSGRRACRSSRTRIAWERAAKRVGQDVRRAGRRSQRGSRRSPGRAGRRARRPEIDGVVYLGPPRFHPRALRPRAHRRGRGIRARRRAAPSRRSPATGPGRRDRGRRRLRADRAGHGGQRGHRAGPVAPPVPPLALIALLVVVLVVGTWASGVAEAALGTQGPGRDRRWTRWPA